MSKKWLAAGLYAAIGLAAGSLEGVVSDPHGLVAGAPIQVKNKATGAAVRLSSGKDGKYSFAGLAAGAYELSIVMPCCAYQRFTKDVTVDGAARLDVMLAETINGTTLGDDPGRTAAMMRDRAKVPKKPAPRLGGRPDLSGVWLNIDQDPYPERPELTAWALAGQKQLPPQANPHNRCLPGSPPLPAASTPFIGKIVQTRDLVVLLFEDVPGFRQIFLDGRAHPANFDPAWMGHSVGKWEGETLVVDTVGFNEQSWIAGPFPHTDKMRMTERYRRIDLGHLEVQVTFEDGGSLVKPLHQKMVWDLGAADELIEFVCENNKPEHMVGR